MTIHKRTKDRIKNILIGMTSFYLIGALGIAFNHTWMATVQAEKSQTLTGSHTKSATTPAPTPAHLQLLAIGSVAPAFTLTSTEGTTVSLKQYGGKKSVLVEFFATWCPHCQHSVPALKQLTAETAKKLQVLAVNVGDQPLKPSTAPAFQTNYKVTYPILDHPPEALVKSYAVVGVPTIYLIDPAGKIRWTHVGALEEKDLTAIQKEIKANTVHKKI